MFRNTIESTAFTVNAAEEYFNQKITGMSWGRDITFLTTLRALLGSRMNENDTIYLSFSDSVYNIEQLANMSTDRAMSAVVDDTFMENRIHVHNFKSSSQESNDAWMLFIENRFTQRYDGWHRIEKVTAFFHKVFNVLCFINPDIKSVMIFTDNMDIRKHHYLQCGVFAFLPWYFDPNDGVTELEMELINSLREKTSDKYEDRIEKIASKYNFEEVRIRKLLNGFETRYEQIRIAQVQEDIERIMRSLARLDEEYGDLLRSKLDSETTLLGLTTKIAQSSGESEIMEYFLCNKQLRLDSANNNSMQFIVRSTIDYFDEDLANRIINNENSVLYVNGYDGRRYNGQITCDEMKSLMEEIFIKQTLKIRTCAAYSFKISNQSVSGLSSFEFGTYGKGYMPNPHIQQYSCLGNYKRIINERLKESDYIGAIEQCVSSAKSLNFGDTTVMRAFVNTFYGNDLVGKTRFIEDADGNIMSVTEAIKWINNKRDAAENEEG